VSVRPILIHGDPRLRQVARRAVPKAVRDLARDLVETMYAAPGRGLAAPQVGADLRVFAMDAYWKDGAARAPRVFVNPEILDRSGETQTLTEGCLSLPGIEVPVARPAEVTLAWQDLDGRRHRARFDGVEAAILQHEYDHLDGVLNIDRLPEAVRAALAPRLAALGAA